MRTIQLDEDVYRYLLMNSEEIGESASSILRRLLKFEKAPPAASAGSTAAPALDNTDSFRTGDRNGSNDPRASALRDYIHGGEILSTRSVLDRFLKVLGFLHQENPVDFKKLSQIKGRQRIYFSKSFDELEKSGNSVLPQRIPSSPFWTMTNSPTRQKREILANALRLLGYPRDVIDEARSILQDVYSDKR